MADILSGLRHGWRAFKRAPAFSVFTVTILALGTGATTVMYSLVHAVLLRELPFQDPDRLVWMYNQRTERDRAPLSLPDFEDYRREASTLDALAVFTNWTTNLTGVGTPERLDGVRVSGSFFEVLGTRALVGRLLQPQDEEREVRAVVLSHGLWLRRFGADVAIVGKDVSLNGATYTVVGILPPRFLFPFREAELAVPVTLVSDPRRMDRGANFLRVVARLASGVTLAQAKADLDAIAKRLQRLYPSENARKTGISLYPLHAEIVRDYRGMLWTLFASVGVLLLVSCSNVGNLMLVRAASRRSEFRIRSSLGASRARLVRQLLGETTLLATFGGAAGFGVAEIGLAGWRVWGPADFPQMTALELDRHALMFTGLVTAMSALACGVVPAWMASREAVLPMRGEGRTTTANRRQIVLQRGFVAAQVGATTVLLVGMLLLARGSARLGQVQPGFTPSSALSLQLSLPPRTYSNRQALVRFYEALRHRLGSAVESAGVVSLLPLSGLLSTADIALPDRPAPPPDEVPQAHLRVATTEYFDAAGIAVLEGRAFDQHDTEDGQPVAIVSRTFETRHFGGDTAVGKAVQIVQSAGSPNLEIVGVVSDVKQFTLDAAPTADLYLPLHQMPAFQVPLMASRMYWIVRGPGGITPTPESIRAAVAEVDPGVAASSSRSLAAVWLSALGSTRAKVRLIQVFGDVAIALCAVGMYGVAAFAARTRRRELALRAALGATRRDLMISMLVSQCWPIVIGLAAGLCCAFWLSPLLFGTAFETNPRDSGTYAVVTALMATVALLATYFPMRRAASANPIEALQT